jgi:ribosome modulation factor
VVAVAAASPAVVIPVLEGRRPFVEGYKAAIFGKRDVCAYEEGTAEYERWWKGFRGWAGSKNKTAKKTITTPFLEGRRPYVEGYRAAILGNGAASVEVTAEYERWNKGAPWWAVAKNAGGQAAHR